VLKTPTKDAKVEKLEFDIFDDAPRDESPDTVDCDATEAEVDFGDAELEELRKQFVGDVDITEGLCHRSSPLGRVSDDAPLRPGAPSHRDEASLRVVPYSVP